MSQRYNHISKRPKPQDTQLGILKIYVFCRKIQQKAPGPRESAAEVTYLSMKIHPKSCRTLLNGSRKGAVGI